MQHTVNTRQHVDERPKILDCHHATFVDFANFRLCGEVINKITAETGAEIDIKEDGLITVASPDGESIEKALEWIRSLTEEPEVGKLYRGRVVTIKDFGAFVNILPGTDGMLHISQLSDKRVEKVTDVLKEGQMVNVKLSGIDEKGRLSLTMKNIEQ
jgi:polyribonucleotide nucleotidyltransferase